jgi:hypothetical protein
MNKITVALVVVVVAAFLTAAAFGLQNGTAPEMQKDVPEPPEVARNTAIDYLMQAHEELAALQVPSSWEMQNLTPGLLGASNLQYTRDGWTATVRYPVVLEPTYTIDIDYTGEVSFQWIGTVNQDGNISETNFAVVQ